MNVHTNPFGAPVECTETLLENCSDTAAWASSARPIFTDPFAEDDWGKASRFRKNGSRLS